MQEKKLDCARPELVFALIGPAGVRLNDLATALKEHLTTFKYVSVDISLSDLLENFIGWKTPSDPSEYTRIKHRQDIAFQFRKELGDGAALVRAGIAAIRERRYKVTLSPDTPASGYAYILHQLKHPHEVELLRKIYGPSLIVLAAHAPQDVREENLALRMAQKDGKGVDKTYRDNAQEIVLIDDKQEDPNDLGQNTRDAYPLADHFANLGREFGENSVKRFVDLLFGHPFHTPEPHEYAMYQASAVSLRSSDESRQVGAVIAMLSKTKDRITNVDVVATGMNEVPKRHGGFYWQEDSPDLRDQALRAYRSEDRAQSIKVTALSELIDRIRANKWLSDSLQGKAALELATDLLPRLKGTQFQEIGEFGRTVHAEMAALIDGARRGVSVHGHTMYVTTFPCHNCAKHIIAAGIRQVIYLEPYPKSRARFLHGEEIALDPRGGDPVDDRVAFSAYSGIAPRQFQTVFSMSRRGRKKGLPLNEWMASRATLLPRYVTENSAHAYMIGERQALANLPSDMYRWDESAICP